MFFFFGFFLFFLGEVLNNVWGRLFKELSGKENLGPAYNSISAFLDFVNLLTGSGLENFNNKPPNETESPEEEKVLSAKTTDQMETDETTVPPEEKKETNRNEVLRRKIFIPANRLKDIFQLDGQVSKDNPLTKIEKLIEVKYSFEYTA